MAKSCSVADDFHFINRVGSQRRRRPNGGSVDHFFTACLVLAVIFLSGCAQQNATTKFPNSSQRQNPGALSVPMPQNNYLIKQGDQVEISVWGYPEFNTTAVIKEGGTITLPLIGEMKAANLTKEQFIEQLRAKLSQYIQGEIKVNVSVSSLTVQRVSVLGAVTRQENYPIAGEVSLLDILSLAGGTTIESDLHRVKIYRAGDTQDPTVVDIEEYLESGGVDAIPSVRPGDIVFVPKKENAVHEFADFLRDVTLLFGFFRIFN